MCIFSGSTEVGAVSDPRVVTRLNTGRVICFCSIIRSMKLTDFSIAEVTDATKRDELNNYLKRDRPGFVQTDARVWMAAFKIDGGQRVAAIRAGHANDVASDIIQLDMHLRVNEEEFDNDSFIPEASAADILALVSKEVVRRVRF